MSVAQILSMCRERSIKLKLDGGELKLVGQRERLDDTLIALIRGHKPELLRLLAIQAVGSASPLTRSEDSSDSFASGTQELLASWWRDLFGREHIAASAHFFELGGHSLLATRLVNRIRAKLCPQVDLGAVFRHPVLADLARHIDGSRASAQQQPVELRALPPIVRRADSRAPLSYAQQGLWLIDRIEQGSAHYGQLTAYRILGHLNRPVLLEGLRQLVERHDALRTRFGVVDGEPCQLVSDAWALSASERDFTELDEASRGAALNGLIAHESALRFDLTSGVLVRVVLAVMGPGEAVLLLNLHHIAGDGWSVGVLIEELQALYTAALAGQMATLPELPVRYRDYARWQRELFHGEGLRTELDFWRELMQGAPPLHQIRLDRVRPEIQTHQGAELRTFIGVAASDAVKRLASTVQTTLFVCLESLFALFVARSSGCTDVVIGTPVSGRWHPDIERVVGLFANTLPLRHKVDASLTLRDCLRRSHAMVSAVLTHQHCPFELLVDQLGVERTLAYSPVFQVVFALHDDAAGQIELPGLVMERMVLEAARSKFDLLLAARDTGQGLRLEWQYDTTLFDGPSIERLATRFAAFLESAVGSPDLPVNELLLPGELERAAPAAAVEPTETGLAGALPVIGAHGKLDRRARPRPSGAAQLHEAYEEPESELECLLAQVWSQLLGIERVGAGDSFFGLGGNSLAATRMVTAVQARTGIQLPLREVYQRGSVRQLASWLADHSAAPASLSIQPVSRAAPLLASYAQQRLWFIDRMEGASAQYNMPALFEVRGALDLEALQAAVDRLVERHEILRTVYAEVDGAVVQIIAPAGPIAVRYHDLGGGDPVAPGSTLEQLIERDVLGVFDLRKGPVLRVTVLRLGGDEFRLLFNMHHIAGDGGSIAILTRDLMALYAAASHGAAGALEPAALQFADYAHWQRLQLSGESRARLSGYWQEQLRDIPTLHRLPTDRPRLPRITTRGASLKTTLDAQLTAGLKQLASRCGVSLFILLQATYALLLARISGERDIVMGTPMAGRERAELEQMVGCLVNTVVLRNRVPAHGSFKTFLAQTHSMVLGALEHQGMPFDMLVEQLNPPRSASHLPLMQLWFVMQNLERVELALPGMRVRQLPLSETSAKFDLMLSVTEEPDGTTELYWVHNVALFDAPTIHSWAESFGVLAAGVVAEPDADVATLPVLSAGQRALLDSYAIDATMELPSATLVSRFRRAALQTPDTVAIRYGERTLSYAQLASRVERLAGYLAELGVATDHRVAVCCPRSIEQLIAVLGVWQAGAAMVPLDHSAPRQRLGFMVEETAASLVLVTRESADRFDLAKVDLLVLDGAVTDDSWLAEYRDAPDLSHADALAYVLYTSGTTGRPKGVKVGQESLTNLEIGLQRLLTDSGCTLPLRWAWNAPLAFDASLQALTVLTVGGQVYLLPEDVRVDPRALSRYLHEHDIDLLDCTPSLLELLLAEAAREDTALPHLLVGGEAIHEKLWEAIADRMHRSGRVALNVYGPTETTVDATWAPIRVGTRATIGRPLANVEIRLLDEGLEEVPVGGVGECCIGGPGVARGYLARPDLSARRFVSLGAPGKARTFYRSGDLARWLPDGQLAYLGRRDTQVKLRGYRVELTEIEQVILTIPGVTAAAVVVAPGGEALTAYFATGDLQLEASALAARCHELLPEYMSPGAFVHLEAIPLTASGKLDARALPPPVAARHASARVAASATEKRLERIWQKLLGAVAIDVDSSFFALGGHSLLAIRLVSAVREELEVELPLATLFRHPTLAELARVVDGLERRRKFPPVQVADRTRPLPLSFSQYRLWLIDRMEGRSPQYNMPAAYNLQGELNVEAYRRSLDFIVARHEALRTSYREVDGQAVQIVHAHLTVPLLITDLTHLAPLERDEAVREILARDAVMAFDLTVDIMLRVKLLRLAADRHVLVLNMHHIASDGWSVAILMQELGAAYRSFADNRLPELAPLVLQYADFAVWQRNVLTSAAIESELEYWKEQLRGVPQLHSLPLDKPRPARQTYNGANFVRHVTPAMTAALRALATEADVTLFVVLETALAALLGRWSGQEDVVIGTAVAGRDDAALTPLIGFFLNTLLIRNDLSGNPSFRELLERNRSTVLAAFENRDVPFEMLVDSLRPERSLSHSPLFQILFVLHNQEHAELRLPGLVMTPLECAAAPAKFDLLLNAQEGEAGIELVWTYNTDLFLDETVRRIADGFEELIASVLADAQTRLAALNLLTAAQRHEILVSWNDTLQSIPAEQCLHELFVGQAHRAPQRIALIDAEGSLSYGELLREAESLSAVLRSRLEGAECLVGVLLPKGRSQVVAALAIMMAGGAYLPLDVNWPKPRINQILAHAQARLVVCLPAAADGLWHEAVPIDPRHAPANAGTDAQAAGARFETRQSPASLAYVIFTSGSTGTPKGVAIEHRSAVNTVLDINQRFGVTADDRVLAVSALSFDLSVYDLFGLLAVGGCVVFPQQRSEKDPAHWAELLELHHVTIWNTVPACAELLTAHFEYRQLRSETGLRVVMMSGDWIPPALPARIGVVFAGAQIHSLGGATEASIWSIGYPITADTSGRRSVPYGRPLANQSFFVLSDDLQPCPVGVAGQLYIGGVGLAREYYRDAVQTAASFIDHPVLGVRLYRTGDLGRYFSDGNIEFLGRKDQQVKIRGFRIELGEIEAVISAHPAVEIAVAAVLKDPTGVQQLVAYCTLVDRAPESREVVAELRRHVVSALPDYMVPAQYMILAALPLSANQKVDRARLPAPEWQTVEGRVESRGGIERMLLQLYQEVLGRETLHLDRNFFEAGGTSAHLIQIANRASALLQRKIAVVSFFEHPTIESLARFLDSQGSVAPATVDVKRERISRLAELRARRN